MARICYLWLLLTCFATGTGHAQTLRLSEGQASYNLHARAAVLVDPSGALRLADLVGEGRASAAFRPAHQGLSSFGFTAAAIWFRITIDNPAAQAQRKQLVLPTNWLDSVDLYIPLATGAFHERRFGDSLPFAERDYPRPYFVIDLDLLPGSHDYYLRLTSSQAFMTPIELWEPAALREAERGWAAYYGMFYGILLVMVLYNGFIWGATRDRNYFCYCLYLLAFFLMNFGYNGFAYQYWWPQSPHWSNLSHTHWIFLFQAVAVCFAMSFLESARRLPVLHRLMQVFLGALIVAWLALSVAGNGPLYNAAPVYFIFLCTPLILVAGLAAWRDGYRAARFFVLASMASLVGSFCTALTVSGWLDYNFVNFHAAEFGIVADVVLLSLALADRINLLREENRAAEQRVLEQKLQAAALLYQANLNLEQLVVERTAELAGARDDAVRLARTDGLTGVANRRYFEEMASQEFARASRYAQPLAAILFDIDLFKHVNDRHGHAAGDAVIRSAARLARECVREVDFVARIGGEEFIILLPGVSETQAAVTAERLRQAIVAERVEYEGLVLRFTASFGVSQLQAEDRGYQGLVHRADRAMYAAKLAGRNRVEIHLPTMSRYGGQGPQ